MSDHWVLIFAYHFPPENVIGAARPYRFYKYLPRHGYKCHVITAADVLSRPDLDAELVSDPFNQTPRSGLGWQIERLVRKFLLPGVIGTQWALHAYRAGLRFRREHPQDRITLFSTFPPLGCHLAAWWLARQTGLPWVADFRDPLAGNTINNLLPKQSTWIYKKLQRTFLESADVFIANTDEAERMMKKEHPSQAAKVHLIWNGFDPEQRISPLPLPERSFRLLSHAGELYQGRTAAPLLESFERLIASGQVSAGSVRIELVGPANSACLPSPAFVQNAETRGWLKLRPVPVPKAEALHLAQTSDGLLLIQPHSVIEVPAKLYEYLQIGRPILAVLPRHSATENVLEKSGVHYRCAYSDSSLAEFDAAVLSFLNLPSTPAQASPWFEETFNADSQAAALAKLIFGSSELF